MDQLLSCGGGPEASAGQASQCIKEGPPRTNVTVLHEGIGRTQSRPRGAANEFVWAGDSCTLMLDGPHGK